MLALDLLRAGWHAIKAGKQAALKTWRGELRLAANLKLIEGSEFFDSEWYLANNPDVAAAGMSPARHYLLHGVASRRNPSPWFVNDEYYALHNDVRASRMNPLVHYECFGKREGRPILFSEIREPQFPEGSCEGEWRFAKAPRRHARTAVVASYFGSGILPDSLLYLLKGLREVVDNIIYVADCPVMPDEVAKLDGIVYVARFERHRQYDFGSYRRGLEIARAEGLLDSSVADELVLINDSNYGPVFPFAESFGAFERRDCDFWGYTGYNAFGNLHISSYFYVFRRRVIDSMKLDEFLSALQGRVERDKVIVKFEFRLTQFLADAGFSWDTLVPIGFERGAPTKYPLSIMKKFRMPLLKAKAVNGDSYEDVAKTLAFLRKANPELATMVKPRPIKSVHEHVTYAQHQASFPVKCRRIAEKLRSGGKVRSVFFVTNASMFPARPLFDAMLAHPSFDPHVVVVPDLRWRDKDPLAMIAECRDKLASTIPEERLSSVEPDEFGSWPDVLEDADLVCYPSPYELSSFRYNPHYAVGRDFLPVMVNYGFYRSVYDRSIMRGQSYAYMWKAFFECGQTLAEYRACSAIGGDNADLCGYVKMDAYAAAAAAADAAKRAEGPSRRKKTLVALHHSVDGGTNKSLSLANFVRYSDFFARLPDMFPEVDFIYRPHPFLFLVMSRKGQWGEAKTAAYIDALKSKPNVVWSEGGDYFTEFAESDACIQDCGSYLVEYMYTGKPCCYMLKEPADIEAKFAPLGKECLDVCYVAYDTAAIERFVRETVLGGADPKSAARKKLAANIMVNYPNAANVALEHIVDAIAAKQDCNKDGNEQ